MNNLTKTYFIIVATILSLIIGGTSIYAFQDDTTESACTWGCDTFKADPFSYYGTRNLVRTNIGSDIVFVTADLIDHAPVTQVCFGSVCTWPKSSILFPNDVSMAVMIDNDTVAVRNFGKKMFIPAGGAHPKSAYYKCYRSGQCDNIIKGVVICTTSDPACRDLSDSSTTAPVVTAFTASPTSVDAGQSSTLTWASTNADKCSIDGVDKSTSGSMVVSPTSPTATYTIVCSKGTANSPAKSATIIVRFVTSSSQLSEAAKTKLNTWITKNITVRSTSLTSSNYVKFIEMVINKLNVIKSNTPSSNKNKLDIINYIVTELGKILSNMDDSSFLDDLFK